jgi:catechol 2,3-dioxygenase-like lactoylglutathione lyase family enzyme
MLAYATLGTRDLQKAAAYYDAVLAPLGAKRQME